MKHVVVVWRRLAAASLVAVAIASCFAEPAGSSRPSGSGGSTASTGGEASGGAGAPATGPVCVARPAVDGAQCRSVLSGEMLHTKEVTDEPQDVTIFVDDLFDQFRSYCGGCHVDGSLGGFQVNKNNFADKVNRDSLKAIRSNIAACEKDGSTGEKVDADCFPFMPPPESHGKPWSEREGDDSDPLRQFATMLEVWLDSASPPPRDVFTLPAEKGGQSAYGVSAELAKTFSNLGTCIPDPGLVATELDRSCDLDARFASLQKHPDGAPHERLGLPVTLNETDLFTLESTELARHGVIAYAPAYPLWTDDAGKLRHVRVPQGTSIRFDPKTKRFQIPDNTRFYKTFLKRVITMTGEWRYRKIETRVIVSRSSGESLFGTYAWNEQETQATLVTDPLRNGEPFRDRLFSVVVNEPLYKSIYDRVQSGELRNLTYELDQAKAVRRYALPGSERCIQCHMGGENNSFVLGFTPLQVNHRPCDRGTLEEKGHCEGGLLQATGPHELNQLERLIDYGLITNFDPATDLIKLEDPQGTKGDRPARTEEELVAQGYLLGNCAHCHNPAGYPSVLNPELSPLLDFLPTVEGGGIFGFPLDRMSPRIQRGFNGEISLPYITPSLRDIIPANAGSASVGWTKKSSTVLDPATGEALELFIDAPWRSLIYRNVDTPFTYMDHAAIYPHMPLNSPGFDCRAPRIMGDWMVSIPARRKNPLLSEELGLDAVGVETEPQSFVEVFPSDPGFLNAQAEAKKRLSIYRKGVRYQEYCPDTTDIVDIDVVRGRLGAQIPRDRAVPDMPIDGVPDRPHWVITDLTEAPGAWNPRRSDWKSILVDQDFSAAEQRIAEEAGPLKATLEAKLVNERLVVSMLQTVGMSDRLKDFARTEIPFGLWLEKPECDFSGQSTLGDYQGAERPRWMSLADSSGEKDGKPVYTAVPGLLVYNMICVNCHGSSADSRGRQASTLQEMTGGNGRVANFRDGLFGPFAEAGANRQRVFGSDEVAYRYLAWMALGGTNTLIPQPILNLVAGTPVLGQKRIQSGVVTSANMLQVAQALCYGVVTLGMPDQPFEMSELTGSGVRDAFHASSGLIENNGDADFWKALCAIDNPPPVRMLRLDAAGEDVNYRLDIADRFWPSTYPANAPVGDLDGNAVSSLSPENLYPWCVRQPTEQRIIDWLAGQRTRNQQPIPICPADFIVDANRMKVEFADGGDKHVDAEKWALRGAINAGLVVFDYLDQLVGEGNEPAPTFGECEKL